MKKSARNRIIAWSIVSVLLVGVLISGIILVKKGNIGLINVAPVSIGSANTANSIDITEDIKEFDSYEINSIIVNWTNGNVKVETSKTDKILVDVKSYTQKNKNDVVSCINENGTLEIYSEKQGGWNLFSNFTSKEVVITIPEDKIFEKIDVSTASAESEINGAKAESVNMNTASGDISVTNSQGNTASMNSASGDVDIIDSEFTDISTESVSGSTNVNGKFKKFDSESVSGSVTINSLTECDRIDTETVSGSIHITLPSSVNSVNLDFDSVSGSLDSEIGNSTSANAPQIDLETVSGSATVKRAA